MPKFKPDGRYIMRLMPFLCLLMIVASMICIVPGMSLKVVRMLLVEYTDLYIIGLLLGVIALSIWPFFRRHY